MNPDGGEVDSNPFDVAALGTKRVLIADAGANAVLVANRRGGVNWVATLPDELVSTENAKALAGCPDAPPELAEICGLPDEIPAQPVATSVAIGPDGAYYVTELKGFPRRPVSHASGGSNQAPVTSIATPMPWVRRARWWRTDSRRSSI